MRHRDLIDYPHKSRRAVVIAVITMLVLGLSLGGALGTVVARGFEAVHIEQFARQFKGS
jgi:hypothetical protein